MKAITYLRTEKEKHQKKKVFWSLVNIAKIMDGYYKHRLEYEKELKCGQCFNSKMEY